MSSGHSGQEIGTPLLISDMGISGSKMLEDLQPIIIFQQDGAPLHWSLNVQTFLVQKFPGSWIGRIWPNISAATITAHHLT